MKILFLLESFKLGGAERQALMLANSLQKKGYSIIICAYGTQDVLTTLCDKKGIYNIPISNNLLKIRFYNIIKFIFFVRHFTPDIILSYCTIPNITCSFIWRFTNAKACFWGQRDAGLSIYLQQKYPFAVNLSSLAIANSQAGANFLRSRGCTVDIKIIHNGVTLESPKQPRHKLRDSFGIAPNAILACMVANLTKNKQHSLLLKAWRAALDAKIISPDARLILAGRDDGEGEKLKALASQLKIENLVFFVGAVDDISSLLYAADIGILSSPSEGLPNAILEYMYAGLPVVASDIPGIKEALGENSPNLLFRADSIEEFSTALGKACCDSQWRTEAALYNKHRSRVFFSPEAMQKKYEKLFPDPLDKRPAIPLKVWKELGYWICRSLWNITKSLASEILKVFHLK